MSLQYIIYYYWKAYSLTLAGVAFVAYAEYHLFSESGLLLGNICFILILYFNDLFIIRN